MAAGKQKAPMEQRKARRSPGAASPTLVKRSDGDVVIHSDTGGLTGRDLSAVVADPTAQAAMTIYNFESREAAGLNISTLGAELRKQTAAIGRGDLARAEAILLSQAHTLDGLFNNLARRASVNMGQHPAAFEMYLRLALKAQSQCRCTVEALAELKNPRTAVAFVKQANIAAGHQQVNNAGNGATAIEPTTDTATRTEETEGQPVKVLEAAA